MAQDSDTRPDSTGRDKAAASFAVINPATGATISQLTAASASSIDATVDTAQAAQREWLALSGDARGQRLHRFGELLVDGHREIALLDVNSMGKVISEAVPQTVRGARHARYWAGWADKLVGDYHYDQPGSTTSSRRDPLGVYGVILPWNAPAHAFMARTLPALAAGNAVVVKPSEISPLSALRLAELGVEAGLPQGLLSVVLGDGAVGEALCLHPDIGGISFTGSVETGRRVATTSAASFKKVTLELGGKSPIVVFDDADIDSAVRATVLGIARNSGQVCAASTRLLVQEGIAARFLEELSLRLERVRVGDPLDPETHVGPLACRSQFDRVSQLLESGAAEGASVLSQSLTDDMHSGGLYIPPTVLDGVTSQMRVVREEIFGPVLTVTRFKTTSEAIREANDTDFGLSAYVWTRDLATMHRVTEQLCAGAVHGNSLLVLDPALPFGGFKNSGLGNAYGQSAIDGCTQVKRVTVRTTDSPLPSPWPGI